MNKANVNQSTLNCKHSILDDLHNHMTSKGLACDQEIIFDGKIHRYSCDSKKNQPDEWYVGFEWNSSKNNPCLVLVYGSWSNGSKFIFHSWENRNSYFDEKERHELHMALKERREQAELLLIERKDKASQEAQKMWEDSSLRASDERQLAYLQLKKIKSEGVRFGNDPKGLSSLILPVMNISGEIRSLQFISIGANGKVYKNFLAGGEKKGNFMTLGALKDGECMLVAEGFATGSTCFEATTTATVVAFDSGNLMPVVSVLKERYPQSEIVICADDDFMKENNPGRNAAVKTAVAHKCKIAFPVFPKDIMREEAWTDFNDLASISNVAEVKRQIEAAQMPLQFLLNEINTFPFDTTKLQEIYFLAHQAHVKENVSERDFILYEIEKALKPIGIKRNTINSEFKKFCRENFHQQKALLDLKNFSSNEKEVIDALVEVHDRPILFNQKDEAKGINQMFFASKFSHERLILHEPHEKAFYEYQSETGLWVHKTPERVKIDLGHSFLRLIKLLGYPDLLNLRNDSMLNDLAGLLRGSIEQEGAFQLKRGVIHVGNGVIRLNENPEILHPFSAEYYSRNRSEINFNPKAECPRFLNELIDIALSKEDADLLQKYSGQCLLGYNPSQTFLLLPGTPGGGKSTLANVVEGIIGRHNVAQLKMDHLSGRFEIASFLGKTLLTGKDVSGDFLNNPKGGSVLKALIGGDSLSAEQKNLKRRIELIGEFNVIITSNARLHIRLDSDVGAWKRRMLIVEFNHPAPQKPIPNFAEMLIIEEGAGILNWMINGAIALLKDLSEHGRIQLSRNQEKRIDDLLLESDSICTFIHHCVERQKNVDVTVPELLEAYYIFCKARRWQAVTATIFENQIRDVMLEMFAINRRHDIKREGTQQKGFKHICLLRDKLMD